eukprot:12968233-Ditylum_brightwellii.AAC.1
MKKNATSSNNTTAAGEKMLIQHLPPSLPPSLPPPLLKQMSNPQVLITTTHSQIKHQTKNT